MEKQYNKLWWLEERKPIVYKNEVRLTYMSPVNIEGKYYIQILLNAEKALWENVAIEDVKLHLDGMAKS